MARMWIEKTVDNLGALIGRLVYRRSLLFSQSLESQPLGVVTKDTVAEISQFVEGQWQTAKATSPLGCFDAAYLVYRWHGFSTPTLLFIHGSGEQPHDFGRFSSNSFKSIFTEAFGEKLNLILLRAPFHEESQGEYMKALAHMQNYVGMLASTTALLHALAASLRIQGCPRVFGVGVSLGGWVVNLHRAYFGQFIDSYIPMIAGTRLDEVFGASCYRKLTAKSAWSRPQRLRDLLDFEEDFRSNQSKDCYPLLARYDQFVDFLTQKRGYEGMNLQVIEKGHFSAMQAANSLRLHIQNSIKELNR